MGQTIRPTEPLREYCVALAQVGAVPFDVQANVSKAARPDVFSLSVNEAPQPAVTLRNSIAQESFPP